MDAPISFFELFHYAASRVSARDVESFAPDDPGYHDYVREFQQIVKHRSLPTTASFDVTETIGLTLWNDPEKMRSPDRFRRFRTLTNAVDLALVARGSDHQFVLNYCLGLLIYDAISLKDAALNDQILVAFDDLPSLPQLIDPEDSLVIALARILVRYLTGQRLEDIPAMGTQLIAAEAEVPKVSSGDFLWGCTFFNQLRSVWNKSIQSLIPDGDAHSDVAVLRGALLESPP